MSDFHEAGEARVALLEEACALQSALRAAADRELVGCKAAGMRLDEARDRSAVALGESLTRRLFDPNPTSWVGI